MSDNILVALLLLAVLVIFGWSYIKVFAPAIFARLKSVFASTQVLMFSSPRPDAKAVVLTFRGVEIGTRFLGVVDTQEAKIAPPEPAQSRIVSV